MKSIYLLLFIPFCLVSRLPAIENDLTKIPSEELKTKPSDFWRGMLTPEQYKVCREAGTERPFSGQYAESHDEGTYLCSSCGNPLFNSKTKFDSGTGWPSFWEPLTKESVTLKEDRSWFMARTEVVCSHCGAHLGHVFNDGPAPTHQRYCMNSVCLLLKPTAVDLKKKVKKKEVKKPVVKKEPPPTPSPTSEATPTATPEED